MDEFVGLEAETPSGVGEDIADAGIGIHPAVLFEGLEEIVGGTDAVGYIFRIGVFGQDEFEFVGSGESDAVLALG